VVLQLFEDQYCETVMFGQTQLEFIDQISAWMRDFPRALMAADHPRCSRTGERVAQTEFYRSFKCFFHLLSQINSENSDNLMNSAFFYKPFKWLDAEPIGPHSDEALCLLLNCCLRTRGSAIETYFSVKHEEGLKLLQRLFNHFAKRGCKLKADIAKHWVKLNKTYFKKQHLKQTFIELLYLYQAVSLTEPPALQVPKVFLQEEDQYEMAM